MNFHRSLMIICYQQTVIAFFRDFETLRRPSRLRGLVVFFFAFYYFLVLLKLWHRNETLKNNGNTEN